MDLDEGDPLADSPEVSNLVRFQHDFGSECEVRIEWIGETVQAFPPLLEHLKDAGAIPGARVVFSLHGPSVLLYRADGGVVLELQHGNAADLFVRP
ncbi:MAG: hypothetical protein ACTIKQ_04475 [Microbacterium sp.]